MAKQEKKKFGEKLVGFFSSNKIGKPLGSIILGILSVFPLTAPFVPAIKQASAGIAGKDKHDAVAYFSAAITVSAMVMYVYLTVNGETEAALIIKEMSEKAVE